MIATLASKLLQSLSRSSSLETPAKENPMNLIDHARAASNMPTPGKARLIREAAGVTQTQLAESLGVHRMTIARWEAGERRPRGLYLAAYSTALSEMREGVLAIPA
jgi:DNA-binding transcriptional regulator YiaG